MTSYRFFKMAAIELEIYFPVQVLDWTRLRDWKSICIPNFDEISQSMGELKLLPVSENGRPPRCNFTASFDFDLRVVIGMSFCICMPNFVVIRRLVAELWRHIDFSRWRPESEIYFRVQVSWLDSFKKVEIYLHIKFPRDISIHGRVKTTSVFDFGLIFVFGVSFCISVPNFVKIEPPSAELWLRRIARPPLAASLSLRMTS